MCIAMLVGFVKGELDELLKGYWRDLLQSQPNHLELVIEKNTLLPILRPVASQYCIPFTSGRGYCSLPPRHAMAERYRRSGKGKLLLLLVSDFDPTANPSPRASPDPCATISGSPGGGH